MKIRSPFLMETQRHLIPSLLSRLKPKASLLASLTVTALAAFPVPHAHAQTAKLTVLGALGDHRDGGSPYGVLLPANDGNFYGVTYYGGDFGAGSVYQLTPAGDVTLVYSFQPDSDGANPAASLIQDSDGNFYGTTSTGGANNVGTVFKVTTSGVLTVLHTFAGSDGRKPLGALRLSGSTLYGTTSAGGTSNFGTVFSITFAGVFTTLHDFKSTDGSQPSAALRPGGDNNFYGTTYSGGSHNLGTVFKISPLGTLTTLHHFGATGTDGASPNCSLVLTRTGDFYGTTYQGGANGVGTVFKITAAGVLTIIHNFNTTDGAHPADGVVFDAGGNLRGTTYNGGSAGVGTVFSMTTAGVVTTLHAFDFTGGRYPISTLAAAADGTFYGTTVADSTSAVETAGTVFSLTSGGVFTTLHHFNGGAGNHPLSGLLKGSDGNLYGTASDGGLVGGGTIFSITPAGTLTLAAALTSDYGQHPDGTLIQDASGYFYGTNQSGGANKVGTVFRLSPNGNLINLHDFTAAGSEGGTLTGGLVEGGDGTFYGTTYGGGATGHGTVFQLASGGTLTTLHSFTGGDGDSPIPRLLTGKDGNFYGTTSAGGANGKGTIFKITPAGTLTVLHDLNSSDGIYSAAGLIQGKEGDFYGTASGGGSSSSGTVFKLTAAGVFTVLHSFNMTDGNHPDAALVQGSDGNFYGTTGYGGSDNSGTVFVVTPSGSFTSLHQFTAQEGVDPEGELVEVGDGTFYGTTANGGTDDLGVVFKLIVSPAVTGPVSASGTVGKAFAFQLAATNSSATYAVMGLPPGLGLSASTGKISGTPTKAGTYPVKVSAMNGGGTGMGTLTVTIAAIPPVINSSLNPPSRQGVAFSYQITAANGPTSYAATGLPAGLGLSTSTGKISGTPTVYGTFHPVIKAINSGGTGTATLDLVVKEGTPVITSSLNPPGRVGVSFSYQITATYNPTSYGASGLPGGLTLDPSTGKITGKPTAAGTSTVTVAAFNSGGAGTAKLTLMVKPAVPAVTSAKTVSGQVGVTFSYQITATGAPVSYAASGLPGGLNINTSTGKTTGKPVKAGTYTVTVKATNSGGTGTAAVSIAVKASA